jgi:hypothetical protein
MGSTTHPDPVDLQRADRAYVALRAEWEAACKAVRSAERFAHVTATRTGHALFTSLPEPTLDDLLVMVDQDPHVFDDGPVLKVQVSRVATERAARRALTRRVDDADAVFLARPWQRWWQVRGQTGSVHASWSCRAVSRSVTVMLPGLSGLDTETVAGLVGVMLCQQCTGVRPPPGARRTARLAACIAERFR